MKVHVEKKQQNSRKCFVCGVANDAGLHTSFFEVEGKELVALFTPRDAHQSYPGRLHGGIAAAILDETIGRAIMIEGGEGVWGVTVDFSIRYRQPIPLDVELRAVGRITRDGGRVFEGTGEILLPDGTKAAEASGRYLKMPLDRITADYPDLDWHIVESPSDRKEVELPDRGPVEN